MVKVNVTDNPVKVSVKPINTVCKVMFAEKGKDGKDGKDGVDGKDGYTPQKGIDYFDGKDGDKGDPFTYEDFTPEQLENLKPKVEGNTLLASPHWGMSANHIVTLSEPISNQNNGIVLVFSRYDDGVKNDNFNTFFVSKKEVELHAGAGHTFTMFRSASNPFKEACVKYLYITDTTITGHSANDDTTGTGDCGITFNNKAFALRYVIGV